MGDRLTVQIEAFTTRAGEGRSSDLEQGGGGVIVSDSMETIELLTYLVAGLGVIVLGLCVVVASLIIYQHCRKLKRGGGYTPVHAEENGVIPNSYNVVQSPDRNKDVLEDREEVLEVVNEVDKNKCKKENKKIPSVRMKMFTRNNSAKRKSKLEFDANDFDVPIPKVSRVKKVVFNPRISRSDWDIYDSRAGSEVREEIEMLLSRNSKDLSIRSKSPDIEDDFKSQYFDAQESLSDEEIDQETDEDYEDIEDDGEIKVEQKKERKRQSCAVIMKSQPPIIQKRVNALKKLLLQQKLMESELYRDIHKLEGLFYKQHRDQVYSNRRKQVEGPLSQPTILEEAEDGENGPNEMSVEESGIPGFWLRVLLNSKNLKQIVQATDIPVLNNLVDIRVLNFENPLGFRLAFFFRQNEYFADTELTKDYFLKCDPGEEDDPLQFEGPEVIGCQGCKIHWKKHQNLTIRPLKRVQNHKIVTKWARKNSFFNFFNPPKLGSIDDVHHLKRRELLEAHFELGLFFKEQVVPKAYLFFTRNGYDGNVQKSLGKRKLRLKSTSKANTPSAPKTPRRKLSDEPQPCTKEEIVIDKTVQCNGFIKQKEDINENIVENSNETINGDENVIHNQVTASDKTDILESISLPEKDIFPGRYLMESSENFDDFMKALGVGMIKRRLANSVVPINEVEITEEGRYIIKTLTTVRNTELSFNLDEPFAEDTIDGRITQTTATRTGNLLVLDQKGNKAKGEKDSVMTREVEGDLMTMKLIVDNVTCVRVYKRMQE